MSINADELLPEPPIFSDEEVEQHKRNRDIRPILFEWYKYIGMLCNIVATLNLNSPAFRRIPPVHFAVLVGLLNRCSRLMLANIRLSSTGRYGETTRLLDRCIAETAIKAQWLCRKGDTDGFQRYLADGLKKDLVLKARIEGNIRERKGVRLAIEERMLHSIHNCVELSGLSEQEVRSTKRLPDFASICNDLGFSEEFYIGVQRIGSHAVHGTWSDLIFNYLEFEEGEGFCLQDHEIATQDVQFVEVSLLVIDATTGFLRYIAPDLSDVDSLMGPLLRARKEILEIAGAAWASDYVET